MKYKNYQITLTIYNKEIQIVKENNWTERQYNIHEFIYIFLHEICHYLNCSKGIPNSVEEENLANRFSIAFIKDYFNKETITFLNKYDYSPFFSNENANNFLDMYSRLCNNNIFGLITCPCYYDSFQESSVKYSIDSKDKISDIVSREYNCNIRTIKKIRLSNYNYVKITKKILERLKEIGFDFDNLTIIYNDISITGIFKNEGRTI